MFLAKTEIPADMGSTAADGIFPRDVKHFRGTMTVPSRPRRIVVLATGQLDQAINLGVVPVGTTINGFPEPVPAYLIDAFPQHAQSIAKIRPVGERTVLDFQAIAALEPDMIVGTAAGAHGRAFNELNAIAPTFLTEGYGYNWKQDFRLFAELMGEREKATAIMAVLWGNRLSDCPGGPCRDCRGLAQPQGRPDWPCPTGGDRTLVHHGRADGGGTGTRWHRGRLVAGLIKPKQVCRKWLLEHVDIEVRAG